MVPAHLQPIIDRALHTAFGTTSYDDLTPLTGGMRSALACRIMVHGRPYLLRVGASTLIDGATELASTRTAAEAGIAPHVWYANAEDRVLITDFVERAPLPERFGLQIAAMIARIHALPPWPRTIHHLDMVAGFLGRLARSDLDDVRARHAELAAVYPRDSELVSCHNDLKPQNLLYDGQRVWIIDWEAAFVNDRYADLAIAANFFPTDEGDYLAAYFGTPPTEYQRARFFLAQCVNHLSYVALLSLMAAHAAPQPTPDGRAFHAGLIAGTIDLADDAHKLQYANVHLEALRRKQQSPRFAASLARLS